MRTLRNVAPDDGARKIHTLLTTRNVPLERAAHQLAAALTHGLELEATAHARQLIVDPTLIQSVVRIRSVYRDLRGRVSKIHTNRGSAKAHVLDAIDLLDTSFTLLLRGTNAPSYTAYKQLVDDAGLRQARAANEMHKAVKELT